jgi:hypothetical protein
MGNSENTPRPNSESKNSRLLLEESKMAHAELRTWELGIGNPKFYQLRSNVQRDGCYRVDDKFDVLDNVFRKAFARHFVFDGLLFSQSPLNPYNSATV